MSNRKEWRTLPLAEVAEIHDNLRMPINSSARSMRTAGKLETELFPYYGATGQVGWIDDYRMDGRYVLVGEDGAPFLDPFARKAYIVEGRTWVNNHAHILRARRGILDDDFLKHALNITDYRELVNGTTRLKLTQAALRQIPIQLPDLDMQRRIVARIDELFSELDDGEEELARARTDLETYRKALLKAAVTGELTADWRAANPAIETANELLTRIEEAPPTVRRSRNKRSHEERSAAKSSLAELPEGWAWTTLPKLGEFGRGKSKHRPRNDARLYGGPYPFVQTGVVSASRGRITTYQQTYSTFGRAQSKLWKAGTLCITIAANIAKTGVLAFDACFPDSVVGLTCGAGVCPEYVELAVRSLQAQLECDAPATAQKNINLDTFAELPIPLPPAMEQLAIVNEFSEAEVAADAAAHLGLTNDVATLRQSILAAAFRGELVQ